MSKRISTPAILQGNETLSYLFFLYRKKAKICHFRWHVVAPPTCDLTVAARRFLTVTTTENFQGPTTFNVACGKFAARWLTLAENFTHLIQRRHLASSPPPCFYGTVKPRTLSPPPPPPLTAVSNCSGGLDEPQPQQDGKNNQKENLLQFVFCFFCFV